MQSTFPEHEERRVKLAFAEHSRLHGEIEALERRALDRDERELLAGLRLCRAHVERELARRGYRRVDGRWTRGT